VEYEKVHRDVLRAFNDACVGRSQPYGGRVGFVPLADVYFEEGTREIVVRFELPGLSRDEIQLFVERRSIVVQGKRDFAGGENRVYQQVEMDYGEFERRIRLAVDIDVDHTQAAYEAGVLEVRLPLLSHQGRAQQIDIKVEESS
jgi:HSP20 family protein